MRTRLAITTCLITSQENLHFRGKFWISSLKTLKGKAPPRSTMQPLTWGNTHKVSCGPAPQNQARETQLSQVSLNTFKIAWDFLSRSSSTSRTLNNSFTRRKSTYLRLGLPIISSPRNPKGSEPWPARKSIGWSMQSTSTTFRAGKITVRTGGGWWSRRLKRGRKRWCSWSSWSRRGTNGWSRRGRGYRRW